MVEPGVLLMIVFFPLLVAAVLMVVSESNQKLIQWLSGLGAMLPLLLTLFVFSGFHVSTPGFQYVTQWHWFSIWIPVVDGASGHVYFQPVNIALSFGLDGLSLPLLFLSTLVGFLAWLASLKETHQVKLYMITYMLLLVGMNGVFMTTNLFLFFIFFEITLVTLFLLVGIWGGAKREQGAYQLLLYNGIGSLLMLLAFIGLFMWSGSWDMIEIQERLAASVMPNDQRWLIFALLLIAFGIKLPIVPLHTWVLNVHPVASAPISMILSGVLLKMGGYGLIRFAVGYFPDLILALSYLLAVVGLVSLIYGAFMALAEKELKRIIAYSSVSHMGIVLLGISAMNALGLQGAIYQMVSHGLISALMFMISGIILTRTETTDIRQLSGLQKPLPFVSGVFLFAALASLGLPLLSGFWAEIQTYLGVYESGKVGVVIVGAFGLVLTAAYVLRMVLFTMWGEAMSWDNVKAFVGAYGQERTQGKATWRLLPNETLVLLILVVFILLFGLYPYVLGETIAQSLTTFL